MPKKDCKYCQGSGLVIQDNYAQPCVCVRRELILAKMSHLGKVNFVNPKQILDFDDIMYIEVNMSDFKNILAGYFLLKGTSFKISSVQDYFDYRMTHNDYGDFMLENHLVFYFGNLAPNRIIGQYISQLVEERRIADKKTWLVNSIPKEQLLLKLRDGKEDFELFLSKIPSVDLTGKHRLGGAISEPIKKKIGIDKDKKISGLNLNSLKKMKNVYNNMS